jgi:hypothetical protein
MVRSTIAFAVIALGAAAVIAQNPIQDTLDLEAREFNDLEMREYALDDLEARGFEDVVDIDARGYEDEILDAREPNSQEPLPNPAEPLPPSGSMPPGPAEPLPASSPLPVVNAKDAGGSPPPAPTPTSGSGSGGSLTPSKTTTITASPTPTPCSTKELKHQKQQTKVEKAIAVLNGLKGKTDLTPSEKLKVKKAKKFLRRVRRKRVRKARKVSKKCKSALHKAGLTPADCKAGANCAAALESQHLDPAKCIAARKFLNRVKKARKARKASKKAAKKSGKKSDKKVDDFSELLPPPTKTVGSDGVLTVTVTPGPTCTATPDSSSKMAKKLVARDIVDEEFDSVFAREYDFNNLD